VVVSGNLSQIVQDLADRTYPLKRTTRKVTEPYVGNPEIGLEHLFGQIHRRPECTSALIQVEIEIFQASLFLTLVEAAYPTVFDEASSKQFLREATLPKCETQDFVMNLKPSFPTA
jgi:hypothetical protein